VENLFAMADRLAGLNLPILSEEEIAQEIDLARRSSGE
jgi:hypothetical protein